MLSKKDVKSLQNVIKKIKNPQAGLPQEVFDALCKIITHVACELVIIDAKGGVLLTWREDEYWKGWHFPGGLLRFRETEFHRLSEVAKRELGVNLISAKFLFPLNYINSARGHDASFVFLGKIKGRPKDGQFFKTMPKNIIPEHKLLWKKFKKNKII